MIENSNSSDATSRERSIEYVCSLPEGRLALAEHAIRTLDVTMSQSVETVNAPNHPRIVSRVGVLSGEPVMRGTRTPVRAIVENWRMGLTPDEMLSALPHLTQAQIFDALGYYSDHQIEINTFIENNHVPDNLIDVAVRAER